ncbi:Aste57867_3842 [Aphanomyces stellatus]|uniref:Aste57867_3842 protein n=1 Tax=Aphanomyces stellatus TaxID=120398 RepID=A0A485KG46_9STRA|nr:hypothetical protein As57867_003831 [Aphanomyces stellatus]VFT80989.1 Aste57867_3842 [Aphanomyces stellatus]
MPRQVAWVLASAVLASTSVAAPGSSIACPYSTLSSTLRAIIVADIKLCQRNVTPCILSLDCARLPDTTPWLAIGNFVDLNETHRTFQAKEDKLTPINVDYMAFSDAMASLSFSFFNFSLPHNFTWPSQLAQLNFTGNGLSAMPRVPRTLNALSFRGNRLSNWTELQKLPPPLQTLDIGGNAYIELLHLNFANLTAAFAQQLYVDPFGKHNVGQGPALLVRVMYCSPIFHIFTVRRDLSNLALANWIMNPQTFKTLGNLMSMTAMDTQNDSTTKIGVVTKNTTISSNATECQLRGGQIQTLTSSQGTPYTVCVINDIIIIQSALSTGAIIGIVCGAIALATAIGVAVFIVMRKRQKELEEMTQTYGMSATPTWSSGEENALTIQDLALVKLDETDLVLQKKLGHGAFADVWLASFHGKSVAVKMLHRSNVSIKQLQSFIDEIKLMSSFDCQYIVKLVGATWARPSDLKCIMEYMNGGDLRDYLARTRPADVTWMDKYAHIHNIVEGLVYLHSLGVIHRDLKSRNILLDSTKGTKLTDFGISKEDLQETMTMGVGTFRWMAPEVIQDLHYTVSADMYSFGALLNLGRDV